jgi:chromate transport protein ChrA
MPVGPHLGELARYLPGYSVSTLGALIGAAYAGLIGAALGVLLAMTWNLVHALLLALIRVRAMLAAYPMD